MRILNVGQSISASNQSIVTQGEGTFFSAMFSGRHAVVKEVFDRCFIDRDPILFAIVLQYLRTGHLPRSLSYAVENEWISAVEEELEFFCLEVNMFSSLPKLQHRFLLLEAASPTRSRFYLIGGQGNHGQPMTTMESFDPSQPIGQSSAWRSEPPMQKARECAGCAVLNGKIYVMGGQWPFLSSMECFDPQSKTWTELESMNEERFGCASVVHEGKIYAIGGQDSAAYFVAPEWYDEKSDSWHEMDNCHHMLRQGHAAAVLDGKIIVLGGNVKGMSMDNARNTVEFLDPVLQCGACCTGTCTGTSPQGQLPAMHTPRLHPSACLLDGLLYAIGGGGAHASSVERFDVEHGRWDVLASMHDGRMGCASGCYGGKIYVFGGRSEDGILVSSIECFDPCTAQWTLHAPSKGRFHSRAGLSAAMIPSPL